MDSAPAVVQQPKSHGWPWRILRAWDFKARVRWRQLFALWRDNRRIIEPDAEAALYSVKTFVAAIIAFYVSVRVGFSQLVWALTTVYVTSNPLAGAVLSKSLFRALGTLLGAAATVVFVPNLVNEPLVLSFVLALWLGGCVYIAQVDRTPRSYLFLLAGYTASITGFPGVQVPGNIFNTAVLRVQEIGIGLAAAALVHGAVFPRTVANRLQNQIKTIVSNAERWSGQALAGCRDPSLDRERRQLASNVNEIDQLSYQIAYDTLHLLSRSAAIRALQDQLGWVVPLNGVVEDRIAECIAQEGGLPAEVVELVARIGTWLTKCASGSTRDETARELVVSAERIEQEIGARATWQWREMLLVSLLARLAELVTVHRLLRELADHIVSDSIRGLSPEATTLIESASGRSLHRDHGLALRCGVGSTVAIFGVCTFWIMTAWSAGATAALISGICCALFGTAPYPNLGIRRFFYGSLVGIATAAVFGWTVFPRVTDFTVLCTAMAPPLLVFASMQARPSLAPFAVGEVLGFVNTVGIAPSYQGDFGAFINGAIAQVAGTAVAIIAIDSFNVIGAERAFAKLFRAGFRDIAARAGGTEPNTRRWTSRMMDRIGLIAARAGPSGIHPALPPYDALVGLRIGYLLGELHAFSMCLPDGSVRNAVKEILGALSAHYRSVDVARRAFVGEPVLNALDRALAGFATDPQPERRRRGAILLTGLRRTLFPRAEPFVVVEE